MANKKFTDLSQASAINETDIVATSQYSGGMWSSLKATISQIANKIVSGINYNSLNTTDKTIIGAINEAAQSGGSGGHTILDNDGNALSKEDNLQFVGVYSEDDSVNDTTKVNIVREMTQAQYDLLSADEKKGIIRITDKNYVCEASEVKFGSGNVEAEVEKKMDWKSNGILGAKNLLPYPYAQTTREVAGITTTDLGDGSLDFDGTSTSQGVKFTLVDNDVSKALPLLKRKYLFTWGNTTAPRIDFTAIKQDNTTETIQGTDGYILLDNTNGTYKGAYFIRFRTGTNVTIDHKKIYPMMRYAEDTDKTWQPYAMTNKELTDVVNKVIKNVPDTAGTYSLQAVRNADDTITYSWVSPV